MLSCSDYSKLMTWDWLNLGKRKFTIYRSWQFSWPDAKNNICMRCAVARKFHDKSDHAFIEKEQEKRK